MFTHEGLGKYSSAKAFAVCTEQLLLAHEGSGTAQISQSICYSHTKAQVGHISARAFAVYTQRLR